ncbi:hypothetical protein FRACA_180016 [Frankia canadensis]|uniref:Uncharacterized protein n=1 Tax=Frankia canadensis TaxID=1836972 RepID=A0A2I2KNN1_9ACTN|nr:hypothetical protein FRACA_180016 [Frankia canadensis]SOU54542.1 hypothetical protein FRACA_180016 [Frankia canadensis]
MLRRHGKHQVSRGLALFALSADVRLRPPASVAVATAVATSGGTSDRPITRSARSSADVR